MATAWTRAPQVLAAMRAEGRYPDSTSRRSKGRERRTVANTTNPVMRVIELSPAVISVRLWASTTKAVPVARSMNATPVCEIIEPITRYQTGTKATSRIQANRFRTCPARLSRRAVSSCCRMSARLLLYPPAGQVADPVETLVLEDQVADDHRRGAPFPQLAGQAGARLCSGGPFPPAPRPAPPRRALEVNAGPPLPPADGLADPPCCRRGPRLPPLSCGTCHRQPRPAGPGRPGCCLASCRCA